MAQQSKRIERIAPEATQEELTKYITRLHELAVSMALKGYTRVRVPAFQTTRDIQTD